MQNNCRSTPANEGTGRNSALGPDLGLHLSGMQGRALNETLPGEGFKHNEQSVRVVESIERRRTGD